MKRHRKPYVSVWIKTVGVTHGGFNKRFREFAKRHHMAQERVSRTRLDFGLKG